MRGAPGPDDTLEVLEGDTWGDPPAESSYLVKTVHRLRTRPIGHLDPEELRILIGQGVGLAHLVPRAVALLSDNPLVKGDFYPGDLLVAVLRVDRRGYWDLHPDLLRELERVARSVRADADPVAGAVRDFLTAG